MTDAWTSNPALEHETQYVHGVPEIDQHSSPSPDIPASDGAISATVENLGLTYDRSSEWLNRFGLLADRILADLHPTTVLDVGCGPGMLVEALVNRGIDAAGIDPDACVVGKAEGSATQRCTVGSATASIEGQFDLVVALEMFESLSPSEGAVALKNVTAVTDRILLAPAPFGGDSSDIGGVAPLYWSEALAQLGFCRDLSYDASGINQWAALYTRQDVSLADAVSAYERSEWTARHEAADLRRELAAIQQGRPTDAEQAVLGRLARVTDRAVAAEQSLRVARDAAAAAEAARGVQAALARDLEHRLEASESHVSAWRDLSIANERQAGIEAIKQLEDVHSSTTWRFMWLLLTPYRMLRGRK